MIRHSQFKLPDNPAEEHFFAGSALPGLCFEEEARKLLADYSRAMTAAGCSETSEILLRFHLSDITNQAPLLRRLLAARPVFISMLGQPPADGARIALEAWHWRGCEKRMISPECEAVRFNGSDVFLFRTGDPALHGSADQTRQEFEALKHFLAEHDSSVEANTVRTWLYCRDVDNNYAGLVRARNEFFAGNGLTAATHFIASTGIEAQHESPSRLVAMESLSWAGLRSGQQLYLKAEHMLSPTALYGVSFERGTRLLLHDRSHYYISGTASIDSRGQVVHSGDVRKQTVRMIENIAALLESSAGSLSDLRWATVYLRDPADASAVRAILEEHFPAGLPYVILRAPVCRPAWLVETECIAVNPAGL